MENILQRILLAFCLTAAMYGHAQNTDSAKWETLYNEEHDVFLNIQFDGAGSVVPGHELFGELHGYIGKPRSNFYWLIVSLKKNRESTDIQLINDYGSEDLTASLIQQSDSTFQLTQRKGSTIKLPHKGKWQKLPKSIIFTKKAK